MHFGRACFLRNRQKHPSNLVRQSSAIATAWGERIHGTQTGMLHGIPWSARCVQRFDDSRNSAIHITYRVSLRSSSMGEPRDPLSKVVLLVVGQLRSNEFHVHTNHTSLVEMDWRAEPLARSNSSKRCTRVGGYCVKLGARDVVRE